jgi:hypothetical protein
MTQFPHKLARQATLNTMAREFTRTLQRIAMDWPFNENLSKKLKVLREESQEGNEATQGRSGFWRRAEECADELTNLYNNDKWPEGETWTIVRNWSQSFDLEES